MELAQEILSQICEACSQRHPSVLMFTFVGRLITYLWNSKKTQGQHRRAFSWPLKSDD